MFFAIIRKTNRTNKYRNSSKEAEIEKLNQEAFEIVTTVDPSFLLKIPCSKTPLDKYLSSTIKLILEKFKEKCTPEEISVMQDAINRLVVNEIGLGSYEQIDDDYYDKL